MTRFPVVVGPEMKNSEARRIMQRAGFRHLPVVEEGRVVGIVSQRDLLRSEECADQMEFQVEDVMTADPYVARSHTPLAEVAREMAAGKFGSAVVLNSDDEPVGIFTTTDALKLLSEVLERMEPRMLEVLRLEKTWWEWDATLGE